MKSDLCDCSAERAAEMWFLNQHSSALYINVVTDTGCFKRGIRCTMVNSDPEQPKRHHHHVGKKQTFPEQTIVGSPFPLMLVQHFLNVFFGNISRSFVRKSAFLHQRGEKLVHKQLFKEIADRTKEGRVLYLCNSGFNKYPRLFNREPSEDIWPRVTGADRCTRYHRKTEG